MAKVCSCGCGHPIFSGGLSLYCWKKEQVKQIKKSPATAILYSKTSRKAIAKKSKKRSALDRLYAAARKAWLPDHLVCEMQLPGCTYHTTEVHHTEGRETPEKLLDTTRWLGGCHNCHAWVTEHSAEAIEMGLSGRRNIALQQDLP